MRDLILSYCHTALAFVRASVGSVRRDRMHMHMHMHGDLGWTPTRSQSFGWVTRPCLESPVLRHCLMFYASMTRPLELERAEELVAALV